MAKILRKNQKIFGAISAQSGQFGSARAGTMVLSTDPDVIQALPAWESGWDAATISGDKLPTLEEDQGINFVLSRQIAYVLQEGIAEYNAVTEYHQNSLVKETGTVKIYKSKTNTNIGNALTNPTHWQLVVNFDSVQPLDNYTATVNPTVNDDSADGYSQGSTWFNTVSGDLFICVSATVGAAIWIDTGVSIADLGSAAFLDAGSAIGDVVQVVNVSGNPGLPVLDGRNLTNLPASKFLIIEDQKASGTDGGTFTSGGWQTRTLNTEVFDNIGSTLSSNQFTLPAGTYKVKGIATGFSVSQHQCRLRNMTDGVNAALGTNALSNPGSSEAATISEFNSIFTIAGTKTFELQHQCAVTKATNGYGVAGAWGVEVYSQIVVEKLS